jgi:hypothetical protein
MFSHPWILITLRVGRIEHSPIPQKRKLRLRGEK